ncbi:MAG: endonuclease MutS2 [Chloroflexi bacterium]|nr:endonuclease MutS2 [Chloroflexota bacterium]
MDEKSLEILEFPEIRRRLAEQTSFSTSRELVLGLKPLADYETISLRLKQSAEARHLLSLNPGFTIGQASDIREIARAAALGKVLEPLSLIECRQTLAALRLVRGNLSAMSKEAPLLWNIAQDITGLPEVEKDIDRCLSPDGEVLDRASKNLAGIRRQLGEVRQTLRERLETLIRAPETQKIIQEPIITEREGRYVIPVKTELRKGIEGITHDVSNTGATVFVEPVATIELGNTVRELVSEEKREVERILRSLSMSVGDHEAEIAAGISRLAELDMALAKAKYARAVRASEPELIHSTLSERVENSPATFIKLVNARHPLLGQKAVPLSIEMGRDFSTLVITGPNTGGKTVALKTIGLLILMTQAGLPIPASPETSFPVFDSVFADIGDEQSVEQTLSSFSWHVSNLVRIIKNATAGSLVLLDELGKSTDPAEGSALARAVLLHFLSSRILTVATTHYGDLKVFAHTTPGMQNASFDFDPATFTPTYHLTLGIPGGSNALVTAEHLGLPPEIVSQARSMLSRTALALEATLADIMTEKEKIKAVREQLEKEKEAAEAEKASLQSRLNQLKIDERRIIQDARDTIIREAAELQKQIRQANSELRKTKSRQTIDSARKTLADMQTRLSSEAWQLKAGETEASQPISVGDTVYLRANDITGTVLSISEQTNEVELLSGRMKLKVGLNSVEKVPGGTAVPSKAVRITRPALKTVPAELDLRGKRADEVEVLLDSYLNDAALSNLNEVLIIHGVATGTVRQITRDFLASHPLVKAFRPGQRSEGGEGTTVVRL